MLRIMKCMKLRQLLRSTVARLRVVNMLGGTVAAAPIFNMLGTVAAAATGRNMPTSPATIMTNDYHLVYKALNENNRGGESDYGRQPAHYSTYTYIRLVSQ
jgi:hypothetical protein